MMNDAVRFWDETADKYARSPARDAETYQQELEITRQGLAAMCLAAGFNTDYQVER